jgi:hypothetical protein
MKKCIWCNNTENDVTFNKKAHTIPKSLGGQNYNQNVCDECNPYFGNRKEGVPFSIEETFKEVFNISRYRLLNENDTKKKVGRFKSMYFELNRVKNSHGKKELKLKRHFHNLFHDLFIRYFKQGLYKVFLEEYDRQNYDNFNRDDIIDFAGYDKGNMIVFYFSRIHGIILTLDREAEIPELIFNRMNYLYSDENFIEIEFLGHVFGLQINKCEESDIINYKQNTMKCKENFFTKMCEIKNISDIDITRRD